MRSMEPTPSKSKLQDANFVEVHHDHVEQDRNEGYRRQLYGDRRH